MTLQHATPVVSTSRANREVDSGIPKQQPAALTFLQKYKSAAKRNNSLLCIGLDPDPEKIPEVAEADGDEQIADGVGKFLRRVVDATSEIACTYKPNAAFFEALGPAGMYVLQDVIGYIHEQGVPVLLDGKRGDVSNTSHFYAIAAFDKLGADSITANLYAGHDALEPFFAYEDRHTFVLCRTSNAGGADVQDLVLEDGRRVYERVAEHAREWNTHGNVGLVVGATYPEEAARVRAICPDQLLLLPGVGAQGASLDDAVAAALDADGGGILVAASRSVLYPAEGGGDLAGAARAAATELRDAINGARERASSNTTR